VFTSTSRLTERQHLRDFVVPKTDTKVLARSSSNTLSVARAIRCAPYQNTEGRFPLPDSPARCCASASARSSDSGGRTTPCAPIAFETSTRTHSQGRARRWILSERVGSRRQDGYTARSPICADTKGAPTGSQHLSCDRQGVVRRREVVFSTTGELTGVFRALETVLISVRPGGVHDSGLLGQLIAGNPVPLHLPHHSSGLLTPCARSGSESAFTKTGPTPVLFTVFAMPRGRHPPPERRVYGTTVLFRQADVGPAECWSWSSSGLGTSRRSHDRPARRFNHP